MCVKASNSKGDARTVGYEGGKIHCLWRALEQGLFPDERGRGTDREEQGFRGCLRGGREAGDVRVREMERNRAFVGTEGRMSVCYDSAPVPVRAKAANRKRV